MQTGAVDKLNWIVQYILIPVSWNCARLFENIFNNLVNFSNEIPGGMPSNIGNTKNGGGQLFVDKVV